MTENQNSTPENQNQEDENTTSLVEETTEETTVEETSTENTANVETDEEETTPATEAEENNSEAETEAPVEVEATTETETSETEEAEEQTETVEATTESSETETVEATPEAETKPVEVKEEVKTFNSEFTDQFQTPGDFDWDADEKGFDTYSKEERAELEEMYSETISSVTSNEIINGTVAAITDRDVVLNIGFKSDGLVPLTEFRDLPDLKIGDQIEVLVVDQEDQHGQLVLSRKHAKLMKAWDAINSAFEDDLVLEGKVKNRTKGGLVVDMSGIETFLPGSQIDVKPVRDYDQYVGKTMEFKVVKINQTLKNAVVSHKILIEKDLEKQKLEIISKLEKGQVLEGVIKNMTDFGVFIDLGGVDGLLHITDISWGRISHPSELLKLDQKINVVVLDYDDNKKRISLGLKQLEAHPWDTLAESVEIGSKIKGKIVTVADYGSFVEIKPGVEGLIHVSEMSWSQHLRNPQDFHKVGDVIDAVVLSIDKEDHKMSLGIKQLTPDPWLEIETKYPVGSKHKGTVRNLTNFGLFVELNEGVDGLVHVSDLSWTKKINHPSEYIKKGEAIEIVVLEIDKENRRLSLGHKQLEEDPWDTFGTIFIEDSLHEGTLLRFEEKNGIVALPYGVEAVVAKKHLSKEDGSTIKVDEVANFKVLELNKDNKRISVSHTATWKEEGPQAEKSKGKRSNRKASKKDDASATLGELGVLSDLKEKFKADEQKAQKEAIKKMDEKMKSKAEATADSEDAVKDEKATSEEE